MGKKGKKSTPPELDFAFDRDLITEDEYQDFWPKYWKAKREGTEGKIIRQLQRRADKEDRLDNPLPLPKLPTKGAITSNRKHAEREAKKIGGYVVRRDRFGHFNPRGRTFQAIKHGNKKR